MVKVIHGEIQHTEKTIQRMFQVEYHTYEKLKMLTRAGIGAALIGIALVAGLHIVIQGILMLAGCWLLISPDFPADCKADKSVMARGGVLPMMRYGFEEDGVFVEEDAGKMKLQYSRIQRLVEDQEYLYLFLGKNSVCMVDRESLDPPEPEELKSLLSERTGMEWTRDKSLLSMNLQDVIRAVRDRKK